MSDEDWQAALAAQIEAVGGEATVDSFERTEVSGYSALYMAASTSLNGVDMQQSILVVETDTQTISFNFTDVTGSWADAFAAAIDSISVA